MHERSVQSDFLIALLRELQARRRSEPGSSPLKVVLMSATLDANMFANYFSTCPGESCSARRTRRGTSRFWADNLKAFAHALHAGAPREAVHTQ